MAKISKFNAAIKKLQDEYDALLQRATMLQDIIRSMQEADKTVPSKRQRKPRPVEAA